MAMLKYFEPQTTKANVEVKPVSEKILSYELSAVHTEAVLPLNWRLTYEQTSSGWADICFPQLGVNKARSGWTDICSWWALLCFPHWCKTKPIHRSQSFHLQVKKSNLTIKYVKHVQCRVRLTQKKIWISALTFGTGFRMGKTRPCDFFSNL